MNDLALCLMVKNEEEYIQRCIESVIDIVNSIYILDTGSTDNTVSIAKNYTDKIYFKSFNNNYGNMRNYLLSFVKEKWILFLDADEYFTEENKKRLFELITSIKDIDNIGGIKFYRYNFFCTGGWYTDHVIKLFINHKGLQYDKAISEKIEPAIKKNNLNILEPDIILNHLGQSKSRDFRDKKTKKYLEIMKNHLKGNPSDGNMHSYVGINLMNLGMFEDALEEAKLGIYYEPSNARLYSFLGNVLRSINKHEDAIKAYKKGLEIEKGNMRSWIMNMIGIEYLTLKKYDDAKYYFKSAIKNNKSLIHIKLNLGLTYFFEEKYSNAMLLFEQVVKQNNGFLNENEMENMIYDPFIACSYETIHNYKGLKYYIAFCWYKINC